MRRREVLAGFATAWPLATRAQQTLPMVGFLSGRSAAETASVLAAFHRGLAEIGFAEAKNLTIKYRWAEGRYERLRELAAELVDSNPVVLAATGGSSAALAAKAATSTIPIVFTVGGDPVKLGLVESLSRPGRNVTGVTLFITEVGGSGAVPAAFDGSGPSAIFCLCGPLRDRIAENVDFARLSDRSTTSSSKSRWGFCSSAVSC